MIDGKSNEKEFPKESTTGPGLKMSRTIYTNILLLVMCVSLINYLFNLGKHACHKS